MRKYFIQWLLGVGISLSGFTSVQAQVQQITLTRIGPTVTVTDTSGQRPVFEPDNGAEVYAEDLLVTSGVGSRVILVFSNGATINIGEESEVEIRQFTQDPFGDEYAFAEATTEPETSTSQTRIHLTKGELIGNVKSLNEGSSFEISTPAGAAGIRGTTFRVVFRPAADGGAFFSVTTIEGEVLVSTISGALADSPISVGDQTELEILVEIDDETGEVTVLTPVNELATTAAPPEVIAQVTTVVQEAAEEVALIVLNALAPGSPTGSSGDSDTGSGDEEGSEQEPATTPPPTNQQDNLSPEAGQGG
jgi:hypothetical protein